jgi:hypothetical protein
LVYNSTGHETHVLRIFKLQDPIWSQIELGFFFLEHFFIEGEHPGLLEQQRGATKAKMA